MNSITEITAAAVNAQRRQQAVINEERAVRLRGHTSRSAKAWGLAILMANNGLNYFMGRLTALRLANDETFQLDRA